MEHARKMVLVPQESIELLTRSSNDRTVQTPGTTLSRLDEEMNEILNSDNFKDEREKCKAYLQVLQRYLHFVGGMKRNTTPPKDDALRVIYSRDEEEEGKEEEEKKNKIGCMSDSFILESVPQKFRLKAKLLLDHLHSNASNRLNWDNYGTISIDGVRIPESNIVDLVNEAMRSRKTTKPSGRYHFATFLRSVKVPREFVGNQDFWADNSSDDRMVQSLQVPKPTHTLRAINSETQPSSRTLSESSVFFTDASEEHTQPSQSQEINWETFSPLNKRKRKKM